MPAPLSVLSTLALKGVLESLELEEVNLRFDATQAILKTDLDADLLVLTAEALEELQAAGKVKHVRTLGSSGVGIAVRAGASRPDIGSVEALKRTLEAAQSVAHSKVGASGLYFAGLVERLNIKLKKRVVVEKGPVGLVVASGEAEIGVQQLCELAPVPGIDIVGPLPHPVQELTYFSAGIPAGAANVPGALALLERLRAATAEGLSPRRPTS